MYIIIRTHDQAFAADPQFTYYEYTRVAQHAQRYATMTTALRNARTGDRVVLAADPKVR